MSEFPTPEDLRAAYEDAIGIEGLRGGTGPALLRPADDRILALADRFREAPAAELLSSWGRST